MSAALSIRSKLIINALVTFIGTAVVVSVGVFAVERVRSGVNDLTGRTAPLQIKTGELQLGLGQLSNDMVRIGFAQDGASVKKLSEAISADITLIESVSGEIRKLDDKGTPVDVARLKALQNTIVPAVEKRLEVNATFQQESASVAAAIANVEASVSSIRKGLTTLGSEALSGVSDAQRSNTQVNTTIKRLLVVQAKLKDVEVLVSELEKVKNKFRLGPVRERIKALTDSILAIPVEKDDPPVLKDARALAGNVFTQFTKDGTGLIAMRGEMVGGADMEGQYLVARRNLLASLEGMSTKVSEAIDSLELQTLKGREKTDKSLSFQSGAAQVANAGGMVSIDVKELANAERQVRLSTSATEVDKLAGDIAVIVGRVRDNIEQMKKGLGGLNQAKMLADADTAAAALTKANESIQRIVATKKSVLGSETALEKAIETVKTETAAMSRAQESQVKNVSSLQAESVSDLQASVDVLLRIMILSGALVALAGLMFSAWLYGSTSQPLARLRAVVQAVGRSSDFTHRVPIARADEVGETAHSFNELLTTLQQSFSKILADARKVSEGAHSLSVASVQVASSSGQQSAAAAAMAATVEQVTASIAHISDSSQEALRISHESGELSRHGGEIILSAVDEMTQLAESVRHAAEGIADLGQKAAEISAVVQLIKEVADQTNLLALNAAIEAARAGEQGRGFAVVADEVRKLAERTTQATNDIKRQIEAMQGSSNVAISTMKKALTQANGGVALAEQAGGSINQIREGVDKVVAVVNNISHALAEQTAASQDIALKVENVASMTEKNNAAANDSAQEAKRMEDLARAMRETVGQFKI